MNDSTNTAMKTISKIFWYWNRLRLMNAREVVDRTCSEFRMSSERLGFMNPEFTLPINTHVDVPSWLPSSIRVKKEPYLAAAEKLLEGELTVFDLSYQSPDGSYTWNTDPKTGTHAPMHFGKKLDYRNPDLVGDIKFLWEPNRHLHLVTVAQAYHLSGDSRFADYIRIALKSWFDQCPYMRGPNWTSGLELAIRLINWSFVWDLLAGFDSPIFKDRKGSEIKAQWLQSIYHHTYFIRHHLSAYSSANNHLIGEASGLFISCLKWPFFNEFKNWKIDAYNILKREVIRQNGSDGVNLEQAISYQQFVLDFLILAALAGKANRIDFPMAYWERIEAMMSFMASIMDVSGNMPMIGDADDGYVVRLSSDDTLHPYRSLLGIGGELFHRPDFREKAGIRGEKSIWLLGDSDVRHDHSNKPVKQEFPIRRSFPTGGYYIMGKDFETEAEVRMIVDCGPIGYLSTAAHGHADALSVYLSVGGTEFLIDPGTYTYHTQTIWRNYFRSTAAHNTVSVDDVDQSVMAGNFMWRHKAESTCIQWDLSDQKDHFIGQHNGYMRLSDPVRHIREIEFRKREQTFFISDTIQCTGYHRVYRFWHFSEYCTVKQSGNVVTAENCGIRISLVDMSESDNRVLHHGDEQRPLGWISRKYAVKVPTTTGVWTHEIQGPATLQTKIEVLNERGKH